MRPVLVELGVHFFGADSVSDALLFEAFAAAALVAGELWSHRSWQRVEVLCRATTPVLHIARRVRRGELSSEVEGLDAVAPKK